MATQVPSVYRIRLRASNCYLLVADGAVLVDSGLRGEGQLILRSMDARGVDPADLKLIVLTHGHADHCGSASEIAAATGAPVAMRPEDACLVTAGLPVPAPPITRWARVISWMLSTRLMRDVMPAPTIKPNVLLSAPEVPLASYGVAATVVHTPGHTAGSVSILLPDGRAIVGDLAMNGFPSSPLKPTPPIVAQHPGLLPGSWAAIGTRGATVIFPGHGRPFPWASLDMRL